MKKLLALIFCTIMCVFILTGCIGVEMVLNVSADGTANYSMFTGYTKESIVEYCTAMGLNESEIGWETLTPRTIDGIEYWGETEIFPLDNLTGNYSYTNDAGETEVGYIPYVPFVYEIADGQYALNIVYTQEDGEVESAEEGAEILADACRLILKFNMPTDMKQVNGPTRGVTIEGNTVTFDMLKAAQAINADDGICNVVIVPIDYVAKDVPTGAWYTDVVLSVIEKGWMPLNEEGEFSPRDAANRADIAYALYAMLGYPETEAEITFEDVPVYERYYDAVRYFYDTGIILGYNDTRYGAEDQITREQVFTLLYRTYSTFYGFNVDEPHHGDLSSFVDKEAVSDWAREAIEWGVAEGIILGDSNKYLNPKDSISNSEIAALLERFDSMK